MKHSLLPIGTFSAALILAGVAAARAQAPETKPLEVVHSVAMDSLNCVTSVAVSPDGRFLYAAAFAVSTVSTFERNIETGELTLNGVLEGPNLDAAVNIQLSHDAKTAVVSSFRANAITLFGRDAETGALKQLDVAKEGDGGNAGLNFVVACSFSKDDRFIYTASGGGLGVYEIVEDRLKFVQVEAAEGKLAGMRDIQTSPDGRVLYAAATGANSLVALRPDRETGKVQLLQILNNEDDEIDGLAGVFRVACSPDGKHLYASSGRFGGVNAVTAFAVLPDGKLKFIEEHFDGINGFTDFVGGNGIAVSQDGLAVYALATVSDHMARFSRDAESGKLTFLGTQPVGTFSEQGCPNLCFSPDGRFIYAADESTGEIVVFKAPGTGAAPAR